MTDDEDRAKERSRERSRADRLKAALRDNLKRRKAQARGRERAAEGDDAKPASGPLSSKDRAD